MSFPNVNTGVESHYLEYGCNVVEVLLSSAHYQELTAQLHVYSHPFNRENTFIRVSVAHGKAVPP
jgi:hypothetical protein